MFMIYLIFSILLVLMLMLLNFIISKKMDLELEKMTPFECGFDPLDQGHNSMSMHFFLICVMFLIFDIEIILILPMIESLFFLNNMIFYNIILILFILLIGLYFEVKNGALKWFNDEKYISLENSLI